MQFIEVYRSTYSAACEQRAFVLHAVGIASEIVPLEHVFALCVPEARAHAAREHLSRYELESVPLPKPAPIQLHAYAWVMPLIFVATMMIVGRLADTLIFGMDWYDLGALKSDVARTSEWWRIVTALTLHVDVAHLLGNLAFGVFFGYVAAQYLGSGIAWISMLFASMLGNFIDSELMPAMQSSIGASTAVFAALGLISAYAWRQRHDPRLRWAQRWAPLVAGISLLGMIGAGGEHTDVLAHLTGFASGCLLGAIFAKRSEVLFKRTWIQWIAGSIGVGVIIGAWTWAIVAS